ncbi:hypothetical protein LZ30DRAFT_763964 [Colletotrichum cereale]|nr:hypothetical protein LZ30DRAFT_763964 [Colletotrichum cereale]
MNSATELVKTLWQLRPQKPSFTEEHVPSLLGKVYVVTGSNGGIGKQVARILYERHARVYLTARSQEAAQRTKDDIEVAVPSSKGELIVALLDLGNLSTIRTATRRILEREDRIHVLFNNAGVGVGTSEAQTTGQGHDRWLGVNNLGPHLLLKLLTPALIAAAKAEGAPGAVRVVWVSSASAVFPDVPAGGVPMDDIPDNRDDGRKESYRAKYGVGTRYGISRAGNILQAAEFARLHRENGVASVAMHPGIIDTESFTPLAATNNLAWVFKVLFMQPAVHGAYTQAFAGLSPQAAETPRGEWIVPGGHFASLGRDLQLAMKTRDEGGTGVAQDFWAWNEEHVKPYL